MASRVQLKGIQRQVIGQRPLPGSPPAVPSRQQEPGEDRASLSGEAPGPISRGVETLLREIQYWEIEQEPDKPNPSIPNLGPLGGPEPSVGAVPRQG